MFATPHLLLIVILVHATSILPVSVLPSAKKCFFSNQIYSLGDTWHPQLETNGASVCATCTCHAGGKYNCTSKMCRPETCPDPRENPSQCCESCVEIKLESSEMDPSNVNFFSCLLHGKIYRDGQIFVTNASMELLHKLPPDQCLQCLCKNGTVMCDVPTCTQLTCPQQIRAASRCCPICDGDTANCKSGGSSYANGVTWYLTTTPGVMGCEECRCNYGQTECNPLRCLSNRKFCTSIKKGFIPDTCCPPCQRKKKSGTTIVLFGLLSYSILIEIFTQKGSNGKKYNQPLADAGNSGLDPRVVQVLCLPHRRDIAVYRSQAASNSSGYCQFLFVFANKNNHIQLHLWTLTQGHIGDFKIQYLSSENLEVLSKTFRFQLIGATNQKLLQKFTNREHKLKSKCNSRCTRKVNRLNRTLKLKEVIRSSHCSRSQTETMWPRDVQFALWMSILREFTREATHAMTTTVTAAKARAFCTSPSHKQTSDDDDDGGGHIGTSPTGA
uniref:VWFC domain-containing protein n=1 Tax=Strigamia maritima TaxID=126957 RepID=T1J447_STRMM